MGANDERIGDYRALTDLELRTKWEPPNGLFIAEGELVIRRALKAGYALRSVLVDAKRVDQFADLPADAVVYSATPEVLESITGFHVHAHQLGRALPQRRRPRDRRCRALAELRGPALPPGGAGEHG
jgi:tRNA G18 (ribose-2'-O)-methylase SpoU